MNSASEHDASEIVISKNAVFIINYSLFINKNETFQDIYGGCSCWRHSLHRLR